MYDWKAIEAFRLSRRELLQDAAKGQAASGPGGDLKRRPSLPSAIGWELARRMGRARKLPRRLRRLTKQEDSP